MAPLVWVAEENMINKNWEHFGRSGEEHKKEAKARGRPIGVTMTIRHAKVGYWTYFEKISSTMFW